MCVCVRLYIYNNICTYLNILKLARARTYAHVYFTQFTLKDTRPTLQSSGDEVHVYVCVYIYIYIYIHTYLNTLKLARAHTHTYKHTFYTFNSL